MTQYQLKLAHYRGKRYFDITRQGAYTSAVTLAERPERVRQPVPHPVRPSIPAPAGSQRKEIPMSAKAVKQPSAPSPAQQGIVGSLQSEVAAEASPLLTFLVAHAAKIAAAIVLFILAIGGYWFYESQSHSNRIAESAELGKILVVSDPAARMERLEAFVKTAPDSLKSSVWFAILETASVLEDNDKLYQAWKAVSAMDSAIKLPAALGMANALTAQEKYQEALALLDGVSATAPGSESAQINIRIALLAEMQGDYARAMRACEAVTTDPLLDPNELKLWTQKKEDLAVRLGTRPAAAASDKG